jgi:rhamnosyltransferase
MYGTKILAIIVTYNCNKIIEDNIQSLSNQVDHILIIDNNSGEECLNLINKYKKWNNITIELNKINYGIGYSLNQGLKFAKNNNYQFIVTMDQDTVLRMNSLKNMLNVLKSNENLVSVAPVHKNNNKKGKYHKVDYLITSGNLTNLKKVLEIGGFNEKLFIDGVDFDFSLSLRKNGGELAVVNNAYMDHKVGEPEKNKFLFLEFTNYTHCPLRYYYIYRNHLYIMKKYLYDFPLFCLKKQIFFSKDILKLLFLEKNKKEKFIMACKGVKDAIKNKYGKFNYKQE